MEILVIAGGYYNIALVIFHLLFWRIFDWDTDLRSLSFLNRAIMQVLNISLSLVFLIFAWLSLAHPQALLDSALGNQLLLLMALFWFARAVQQLVFFKLRHWISWAFLGWFLLGALLYGIPAYQVFAPA